MNTFLAKIEKLFNKKIITESDVLYIFVLIRKFLDISKENHQINNFGFIYFYSNWVLHIEINRKPTKEIISQFKKIEKELMDNTGLAQSEFGFISFDKLRQELNGFTKKYNLSNISNDKWSMLRDGLVNILINTKVDLSLFTDSIKSFSFVKPNLDGLLMITYVIELKEGKTFKNATNKRKSSFLLSSIISV